MIKKIIILLLMVSFACTGCRSGIADDVANEGNIITDQDESDAGINQANPFMDRNRGNMPVVEIDEVYEALTEAVLDNPEIVGELDEEEKQGMANGMAGQILAMLNQSTGLSLVGGVSLSGQDFSIIIYESTEAEKDAEFFKDPDASGIFAQVRPGINETQRPEGRGLAEAPNNGSLPEMGEAVPGENGARRDGGFAQRGGLNMFGNLEDSEIEVIGKYIVIADTKNNSLAFEICAVFLRD